MSIFDDWPRSPLSADDDPTAEYEFKPGDKVRCERAGGSDCSDGLLADNLDYTVTAVSTICGEHYVTLAGVVRPFQAYRFEVVS